MSSSPLRRLLLLPLTLILALTLSAAARAAEPGVSAIGQQYNGVDETNSAVDVLSGAPADKTWVSIVISWATLQPGGPGDPTTQSNAHLIADLDRRIAEYRRANIQVMGVVTQAPAWSKDGSADVNMPPKDVADYARFMAFMADRYAGQVAAWELWNEPDKGFFWTNGPQPDKYTALLKQSYAAIKAAVAVKGAAAAVVVGGLTGNNYDFLQSLYARGAKGHFDGVGTHTSTACLIVGPDFVYREPTGRLGPNVFTAYREVHQTMLNNGDDKPIYMEIGWSTTTAKCDRGAEGGKKDGGVSEAQQAGFLTQAFSCLAADPFVRMATWFSVQDAAADPAAYDHRMGLIRYEGQPKPSYAAMQKAAGGSVIANPACGGKVDVDKPTTKIDVPDSYFNRLVIKGAASDPTTKISRIELWVDGKRIEGTNQDGPSYSLDWFGSTKLGSGKHTVELRAFDEALNVGVASKIVTKGSAKGGARVASARLTFTAKRKAGRRILVNARVLKALSGPFTEKPNGRLRVFFERKVKGKWKPTSHYTKGIAKKITLNYKAKKPGSWRVWARLSVDAPYKNARTKKFTFKL